MGLNIHASLGKFFNFIEFNQLEYTPRDVEDTPINVFGAILRELTAPSLTASDISDNYKVKWYSEYWHLRYLIEERFGKKC